MAWYDSYFGGTTPPAATTSSGPPGERVWEEDRRDEPTVHTPSGPTVHTPSGNGQGQVTQTPIVTTNEIINEKLPGNLPIIQDLGSSNLEKLLTDEERSLNMLYELQNQWEGSGSSIRHDYDEDYSTYPISSPFALSGEEFYDSEWYPTDSTNPYGLSYHGTTKYDDQGNIISGTKMGDPGAVLLNAKAVSFGHPPVYGKPILSGIGEELYNYDWTDGGENPYGTIPNPEELLSRDGEMSPMMEKIKGISEDYYRAREEEDRGGSAWDTYDQQYGMTGFDSLSDLARQTWFSESLSDVEAREQTRLDEGLGVATMANMEQMYGKEFSAQANPLFDPGFSLAATTSPEGVIDPMYASLDLWQEAQKA